MLEEMNIVAQALKVHHDVELYRLLSRQEGGIVNPTPNQSFRKTHLLILMLFKGNLYLYKYS
jgi:hypothetical protein